MIFVVIIYAIVMLFLHYFVFRQMPDPNYFWIGICLLSSAGIIGGTIHGKR